MRAPLPPYRAPWWLSGGHLQTIWPAVNPARTAPVAYQRARWTTPDQDFIDVDWLRTAPQGDAARVLLVLFHGLEGNSQSHYARAFAAHAARQGWDYAVPHFRGCSGEINLAPRAYHSGDHAEVHWILQRLRQEHHGPIVAVGVSLGGNALLRWAQEAGATAGHLLTAVASVCAPLALAAAGHALSRGLNRHLYTPRFLRTMKPMALRKLQQHPGLFSRQALAAAHDLYAFDNVFTAPLHGFRNTDDYWARASAKPHLHALRIPTLIVQAHNDPFVPHGSWPGQQEVSPHVTLALQDEGGHVGFAQGQPPGHLRYLPHTVGNWLHQHCQ